MRRKTLGSKSVRKNQMSHWPVILSGSGHEGLADRLARRHGLAVLVVPDICDLPSDHLALPAMQEVAGPICFGSQHLPRAAHWLLAWHGVKGRRAEGDDTQAPGRRIRPVCLAGCTEQEAADRILAATGGGGGHGSVHSVVDRLGRRWYPVIDYDRCTGCLACVEYCALGTFGVADKRVRVVAPGNCKPGCPTCAWTCPAGAIMFPRYAGGGPVAGEDAGRPERLEGRALRQAVTRSIRQWTKGEGRPAAPPKTADSASAGLE